MVALSTGLYWEDQFLLRDCLKDFERVWLPLKETLCGKAPDDGAELLKTTRDCISSLEAQRCAAANAAELHLHLAQVVEDPARLLNLI